MVELTSDSVSSRRYWESHAPTLSSASAVGHSARVNFLGCIHTDYLRMAKCNSPAEGGEERRWSVYLLRRNQGNISKEAVHRERLLGGVSIAAKWRRSCCRHRKFLPTSPPLESTLMDRLGQFLTTNFRNAAIEPALSSGSAEWAAPAAHDQSGMGRADVVGDV
jgi:hypothetical protein